MNKCSEYYSRYSREPDSLILENKIVIGCGYSGRGDKTETESGEMLTSHR